MPEPHDALNDRTLYCLRLLLAMGEPMDAVVATMNDTREYARPDGEPWTPAGVRAVLGMDGKPPVPWRDFVRMVGWLGHTPADLAQVLNGAGLDPKFRPGPMRGWSPGDALAEMESAFSPGELDSLRRQWAEAGRGDGMEFGR